MELQMAPLVDKLMVHTTTPHHHGGGDSGGASVPSYLRPSGGSCHHACKYGGTQELEEKEPKKKKKQLRRKQQEPASAESQSGVMVKMRSVFRRREDSSNADKTSAVAGKAMGGGENVDVEWKDIVAYDNTVPLIPPHGVETEAQDESLDKKANIAEVTKSVKPTNLTAQTSLQSIRNTPFQPVGGAIRNTPFQPVGGVIWIIGKKKKKPTPLLVKKMVTMDQEVLHGYKILSPSVMQSRASLLRDLEEEMVHDAAATEEEAARAKPLCSLDEEEYAAVVAAETTRRIPTHRRVKSMSMSSRSVWYPITLQASKNSAVTFNLRSRSPKAPIAPPEEEKPATARMGSMRGEDALSASTGGRGIQLRIRSLRRRNLGGGGSGGTGGSGFVVPAVALRHQKTMEKKKSQMLYNNVIEETASKLVKTRKSKVKALVGAFESVINKIAK